MPFFTLADGVDPGLGRLIDEKSARRYQAIPVRKDADGRLLVAMADPSNVFAIDDLRILTRHEIRPALTTPEEIQTLLGQTSRLDAVVADLVEETAGGEEAAEGGADIADAQDDAPVVRLVNSLIARAVDERASDIHFEPQAKEMVVRYRVDGVLRTVTAVPFRLANGVASRIKIMADLDIAERRVPQDGRVGLTVGGRPLDLRVASLPTVYGEKIVIRVLDKSNVLLRLDDLGFAKDVLARFESCYRRPYGAVLVTGPTGSGKSTTLYGALNQINSAERNIITVEDPVEYRLAGINQVQVNPKAGLTFAAGLRSILRCDPDIVMIGEIRDRETAQIAVESALTGHLVLA
ncbi:MAG: GspE/PulE family protein, partial [Thermoleophilia bacterium]|nr:GspE/PulE family protein [Thermoleophilia bacterium]